MENLVSYLAYMEKIKIKLTKSDRIKEILGVISQSEIPPFDKTQGKQKIIFSCEGNIPLLVDSRALKRIAKTASENNKEIEFISSRKFIRGILKNANFTTYSSCPADYADLEEKTLEETYIRQSLPKKNKAETQNPAKLVVVKKIKEIEAETLENSFEKHKIHNPGRKKTSRSMIFFTLILILFLLGGIILWVTPKAKITIKPKLSPIPIIQNVIISLPNSEIPEIDEDLPTIAGVFIGSRISSTETFTASGRRYDIESAHGKVTLFNETNKPKFLVPSRLSTEDGLIFRFKKEVTIPAKKNGKAGEKVVEIFADDLDTKEHPIGYRGNIIAGTDLHFPAFRPELRDLYYAKTNKGPLVGGSTLTHYIVKADDEENSAKYLQDSLQTKAITNLKNENKNRSFREKKQFVLLENTNLFIKSFTNFNFPKDLIGQEKETFEVSGDLELSGIVFDQDSIKKILLKKLKAVLDDRQQLIQLDESSIKYTLLDSENFAEKRYLKLSVKSIGVKSLDFSVNTRDSIEWRENLKKQIGGKTEMQARSILINIPEIEQILSIQISPFWSDRIPKIFNRITFEVDKML